MLWLTTHEFQPATLIELPAGLAGDSDWSESLLDAAQRELKEETGYVAREWRCLDTTCSSPGLTDEAITFFLARGLTKQSDGGGVDDESSVVHEVALADLAGWLRSSQGPNMKIDMKLTCLPKTAPVRMRVA